MSRSRRLGFVPVLIALALAAALPAAAAQAVESHWRKGTKEVKRGQVVFLNTGGTSTIHVLTGDLAGTVVSCGVEYKGEIWNPLPKGAGEGRINAITFDRCQTTPASCHASKTSPITAMGLPWHSILFREAVEPGEFIEGDNVKAIKLEVRCASGAASVIEGDVAGPVPNTEAHMSGMFQDGVGVAQAEVGLTLKLKKHGIGP